MMISGTAKPTYAPGDRVDYTCRPGYRRLSSRPIQVVCQKDDTWTPLQGVCAKKKCPLLGEPSNGRVNYVNGSVVFGSEAHITCDKGFHTIGTKILYCELAGNDVAWSDTVPNCIKVKCAKPAQIPNGRFTNSYKDTFEYSEVVTYSCDPSTGPDPYSLVGQRQLICSAGGNWSAEPPECKVVRCPYPVVENGRPITAIGKRFYYAATVQFECLDGFYLRGQSTVSCGPNSSWLPGLPTCARDVCGDPPRSYAMQIKGSPKAVYMPGDRVEYVCRPGYRLVPGQSAAAVCRVDSTWTPLQNACVKKKCPTLRDPNNGRVKYVSGAGELGSEVRITCNNGYRLAGGDSKLYCELFGANVMWTQPFPQCDKIKCAAPAQIPNGKFTYSYKDTFEFNDVVTYSCDTSNGPDPYSLVGENKLTCSASGEWDREPPECTVVRCPYPVVENGRPITAIGKRFYYAATVQFECLDGFYLRGQSTMSCGPNSSWLPGLPTCARDADTTPAARPSETSRPGISTPSSESSPLQTSETIGVGLISLIVLNVWRQRPLQTFPRTQLPPEKTLPSEGPLTRASVSLDPGKAVTTQSASRRHSPRNKAGS
ncbi:complement receptor type 1-like [Erinaceus europaeus]|uniref:Complement receptor type 1-like n=1 Tax=Erinaceus europaeus TaxID=9365 RepID=A0ABM3WCL6_ERIEU|nr:complement receptor type 1-like [Erinaceus europaeus]